MPSRHKGGVSPPSRLWRTEEATRSPCGEVAAKLCWLLPPGENSGWASSGLSSADPTPAAGGALRPRTRVLSSCCRPRAFIYNRIGGFSEQPSETPTQGQPEGAALDCSAAAGTFRTPSPCCRGGSRRFPPPEPRARCSDAAALRLAASPSGARAPRAAAVVASGGKFRSL